jgi:hypothetical protein
VLSHPPSFLELGPADFLISKIKNCYERDEIRGCFIDPTYCDEGTESDTGRCAFSDIRFIVREMQNGAEACGGLY